MGESVAKCCVLCIEEKLKNKSHSSDYMHESRVQKSLLNARVNLIFYFISLTLAFFSRKIFLDCLGADFIGLTGTIGNLLSFLNLAELGVGVAIAFVLYKPLFDKNQDQINEIISVLGYLYKQIGLIILCGGIILACFLPIIFKTSSLSLGVIFFSYGSFLTASLLTYFINYKETLLSADQRYYIASAYSQSAKFIKIIVQIGIAYYTRNYYYWIIAELVFTIPYCLFLNKKINSIYPWLDSRIKKGKELLSYYPDIKTKIKQIFISKIAFLIQERGIPILIYAFTSLQTVAYYGNYALVSITLSTLLYQLFESINAGVGNLIAEGQKNKIIQIFWEIYALRFYISAVFSISMYFTIHSFIALWLGEKYVLSNIVLFVIITDTFIRNARGAIIQFVRGYGLFDDVWTAYAESIINLSLALLLGYYWGLPGVITGGLSGMLLLGFGWKPYYLFTKGFKIKAKLFYIESSKYLISLLLCYAICYYIYEWIHPNMRTFISWISYTSLIGIYTAIILAVLLYVTTNGFKELTKRYIRLCTIK